MDICATDEKTGDKIFMADDPIHRYTLPQLEPWRDRINEPDLETYCRSFVPKYSFELQTLCVQIKQKSEEWLNIRSKLLTCSNFGIISRTNPYEKPENFLTKWIWNQRQASNAAMEWGSHYESFARDSYLSYINQPAIKQLWFPGVPHVQLPCNIASFFPMTNLEKIINESYQSGKTYQHNDIDIIELGICIDDRHPWAGGSPDGIICQYDALLGRLVVIGLLEIKCPFRKKFYEPIPKYYIDQVQGFMNMFHIPWCHFVTWIPPTSFQGNLKVDFIAQDAAYWNDTLFPCLERFYFGQCLPKQIQKAKQILLSGTLCPIEAWEND